MLRFKEFILEYLTPEQDKKWSQVKMEPEARARTDHFFGEGNDHVREDIKEYDHDKSEIHRKVEEHLGKELSHEEYKSGLTNDKYGRQVKLGKLIKDDKLKTEYSNDSSRAGSKLKQPYMTIVRGHHVAGQTNPVPDELHPTGHAWENESCKNVNTGCNRHYLTNEIKHGSVVVRGHDADGKEIYRATLQPHYHDHGGHLYSLNSEYGIKHPSFTAHAHDVAARLSGEYKSGMFKIDRNVYNDRYIGTALHPGANPEHLTKMLDDSDAYSAYDSDAYLHVLSSHKATPEHIERGLNHVVSSVNSAAARHKNATADQISRALNDKYSSVRSAAMDNPNLNQDHIKHVLTHEKDDDVAAKVAHRARGENLNLALNHPSYEVQSRALLNNPNITANHLTNIMKTGNPDIKIAALKSNKITQSHIDHAIDDDDHSVAAIAARHPKASDENISKAISNSWLVATAALENPNVKSHHVDKALEHPLRAVNAAAAGHDLLDPSKLPELIDHPARQVSMAAINNKNIDDSHKSQILSHTNPEIREQGFALKNLNPTSEDLHKGISDPEYSVRSSAIGHDNITPEHINKALDDPEDSIRKKAWQHTNVDSSNIDKMFNLKSIKDRRRAILHNEHKLNDSHIDRMMNDPDLKDLAYSSPALNPKHITKLLNDPDASHRDINFLTSNNYHKLTPEHIDTILTNPKFSESNKIGISRYGSKMSPENHMTALHPDQPTEVKKHVLNHLIDEYKIKPEHVTEALKSPEAVIKYRVAPHASAEELPALLHKDVPSVIRSAALKNKNITPEHLTSIINEPRSYEQSETYENVANHPQLQPNHVLQMLNKPVIAATHDAMSHKTAVTPNVISMALNHEDPEIARAAAKHDNASSENLHQAVLHPNPYVANAAMLHKKITREHLTMAMNHHPEESMRERAKDRLSRIENG
jgi:hypothetical protein